MKKIIGYILASILVFTVFGFVGCGVEQENLGTGFQSYVSLSINPEVEFFIDKDGIVQSVNAINDDAEIILSDYNFTNMNIKEATQKFMDAAIACGYIDLDATSTAPNDVEYFVISEQNGEELENTVENAINDHFVENGIYGVSRRLEMEELRTSADELGISLGKYKLITRVLTISTEYTIEQLADMEVKDIVSVFGNKLEKEQFGTLRDEFKATILALQEEYSNMFSLRTQMETLEENIQVKSQQIIDLGVQLQNTTDETARIEIQNQIDLATSELENLQSQFATISAEYEVLHNQFKLEVNAIREEYKANFTQLKNQLKLQKLQLVNQNQSKVNQHKNGVNNAKKNQIREWLNNTNE